MTKFDLGYLRVARVWLDELPDARVTPSATLRQSRPAPDRDHIQLRHESVAVEVLIPRGGFAIYGLLGGTFQRDGSRQRAVEVATALTDGPAVDWALASGIDDICIGMPRAIGETVMRVASRAAGDERLPAGVLTFSHALISPVGSGSAVFAYLASAVVWLVAHADGEWSAVERHLASTITF